MGIYIGSPAELQNMATDNLERGPLRGGPAGLSSSTTRARDRRALSLLPADFQQQQKQIQGEYNTELTDKGSVPQVSLCSDIC